MHSTSYLFDFTSVRPAFESSQQSTLDWIVAAHTQATSDTSELFSEHIKKELLRVGCKPDVIHKRGHSIPDFLHQNWQEMLVYRLDKESAGVPLGRRQEIHATIADELFETLYQETSTPPSNLIHVSCTGYASPSGAQKLVSKKRWGNTTQVTHAYHMGCYAACPAVRLASAFTSGADVVHTEMPSLHFNPTLHSADQLVAQSLFADGCIRYKVARKAPEKSSLQLLAIHEEIIPDSLNAMKWLIDSWGFQLFLAKEIPLLIAQEIEAYVERLCRHAHLDTKAVLAEGHFAIHPGGPKIMNYIQKLLGCKDSQMSHSRAILAHFGNMSSATLPHIWKAIIDDPEIRSGTKIVSLAFGPGLTIAGMILEKREAL